MNKYVLFAVLIVTLSAFFSPLFCFADDFFNKDRLQEKSENYLKGENFDIRPDEEYLDMLKNFSLEDDTFDLLTIGIRPPTKFPEPLTTETDSIDIVNGVINRTTKIPGVRVEKYYNIPLDRYKKENFKVNREKLWRKNDSRMNKWSSEEKKDGTSVSDLQFALPVSKRFDNLVGGRTRLDINGSQKITFSGRSEWTEGQIETSVSKNSSFPALTMKQEPRFNIRGNVGERITVDIQQDSQTGSFSNLEENVKIKYQGEKNEIIQNIEAGNTSLNLPGATFAGYRGSHKGLFGIRTEGRFGPLKFTAIASQEKSEANVKSFRGSAEESSNQIRDYQYKTNTYFFLDHMFKRRFAEARTSLDLVYFNPSDSLSYLEVYVDDGVSANNLNENTFAIRGVATPQNMESIDQLHDPQGIEGYYHKLDPQRDYFVDRNLGFIVFTNRVQDSWTVGVYIETKEVGNKVGDTFGDLTYDPKDENSKIQLKLIKAKNQRPSNQDTWDLEWKNVYDLGQRNIDIEGIEVRIYREATDGVSRDTQDGTPFIHILGLDKSDEFGGATPDNKIDLNRGFINQYRGELIFPLLRPFDSEPPQGVSVELRERVPEIYETNNQDEKVEASKFYIEVKTATAAGKIQIGGGLGGIMEGTVQVMLNGNPLQAGTDYRISYMTGEITLLNEEALSPSADLVINYEEMNALQQMQKTLLGFRGEYDLFSESRIGTTLLFNNESTREKRVRLGQEPSRMFLLDTDVLLNFQPKFLTTAVDLLPFVQASEISKIQIEGEIAKSMPNMNTKGRVFVDDFEGSRNTPLSVNRTNWTMSSKPDESTTGNVTLKRGRLQWFNPWDRIESRKIWPNKETTAGENTVHVLTLAYGKPGSIAGDDAFGGVQTAFYGAGDDLSRARFLEIWARGGEGKLKFDIGSISEDYYPFDEPNDFLDTEDAPIPGQGQGDGILTPEEDTGLDRLKDNVEEGEGEDPHGDNWDYSDKNDYTKINGTEGNGRDSDRAGFPDTEDINNNGVLDTKNAYYEYTIDFADNSEKNKYLIHDSVPTGNPSGWRLFRIPLWNNPDVVVGGTGSPDSTLIENARMWITGTDTTFIQIASIEVVENTWLERGIFKINEEDMKEEDVSKEAADKGTFIKVTKVNTDENLNYNPPPGVKIEIDPDTKIRRMEQSLVLEFEKLQSGHTAFIYRTFEKMDFTDYTSLSMYVHGSDTEHMPLVTEGGRDVELIFRFGGDRNNYYEYRTPVYQDWNEESYIDINFTKCTETKFNLQLLIEPYQESLKGIENEIFAINDSLVAADSSWVAVKDSLQAIADRMKEEIDRMKQPGTYSEAVGEKVYSVGGNPSLQNIKVISIGIRNNYEFNDITGDVWFDELRMDSLRDMGGTAARVKLNTDLAGFINVTGNATTKSKDFHDMNSKKGTGKETFDWNSSVKVNLDRFTPARWNLNLPVSANFGGSEALPWLKSGSDIILNNEQKQKDKTDSSNKKYHITYRKGVDTSRKDDTFMQKVTSHFINWTTEKVNADFDYGERVNSSPFSGLDESNQQQLKVTYDVSPPDSSFSPFGWIARIGKGKEDLEEEEEEKEEEEKNKANKRYVGSDKLSLFDKITGFKFYYLPNELNYNYVFNEKNQFKTNIDGVSDTTQTSTISEDYNFGYRPFPSLSYRFSLAKEQDRIINQETSYMESNQITFKPPGFFKLFTQNYSYSTMYNESDNPRYSVTSQLGSKTISFSNSFSATVNLTWYNILDKMKKIPKLKDEKDKEEKEKLEGETKKVEEETETQIEGQDSEKKAPTETAAAEPPKKTKPTIPFRNKAIEALTEVFTPVSLEYKTQEQLNYGGIKERPKTFLDRFQGNVDEPDTSTIVTRQNTLAEGVTYSARTELKLPLDMGLSTKLGYDFKKQMTSSAKTRNESFNYPDIKFTWRNVDSRIPFIKRFMTNISLDTSFSVDNKKSWLEENTEPNTDKTTTKLSQSVNMKIMKNINTSFSITKGNDESADVSGRTKSFTIEDRSDIRSSVRYTISTSKGLPFFKNLKLKSSIDLSIDFGISSSVRSKKIGEETVVDDSSGDEGDGEGGGGTAAESGFTKISSNDSWNITPNISYKFSQKFTGGAKIDIKNSVDLTGKEHKTREVQIWGELIF